MVTLDKKGGKRRTAGTVEICILFCVFDNDPLCLRFTLHYIYTLLIRTRLQSAALVPFLPQEAKHQDCNARDIGHGSRNDQTQAAQEKYNTLQRIQRMLAETDHSQRQTPHA